MTEIKNLTTNKVFEQIKTLLISARNRVVQTVNTTMVYTYFEIGKIIVEHEQAGKEKAKYGAKTLKELSKKLTKEFGKGFTKRNLELMRQFYIVYKKTNTLFSQSPNLQLKSSTLSVILFILNLPNGTNKQKKKYKIVIV
ncbi:MAG: DUF1016 N-terminal domain-containing protein [Candidatus Marinimicrobia bacterium]|jgi:hypothetical protein|nr:DUF1016 N-terminal domain-containing protein [Candidatus Neomarinimicrobiota bacterium]